MTSIKQASQAQKEFQAITKEGNLTLEQQWNHLSVWPVGVETLVGFTTR